MYINLGSCHQSQGVDPTDRCAVVMTKVGGVNGGIRENQNRSSSVPSIYWTCSVLRDK